MESSGSFHHKICKRKCPDGIFSHARSQKNIIIVKYVGTVAYSELISAKPAISKYICRLSGYHVLLELSGCLVKLTTLDYYEFITTLPEIVSDTTKVALHYPLCGSEVVKFATNVAINHGISFRVFDEMNAVDHWLQTCDYQKLHIDISP